ncbi:MAG: NapC/NirT family cytochrome c [Verrucomicrobia bacterium]|nr:NapC/NirT family cytochrome c [Verrucomicrobiota bacterium]
MSIAPLVAAAAETGAFERPEDVVLLWARRAGLVVMFISVTLTLFVLLLRRKRLMESQSKWLLFLGLCVFPIPVVLLSSGVGMEESKSVKFCSSCHQPMGPFVNDMQNPASETLAAIHYKNSLIQHEQCWTCHSDYGISGTAKAKLTGLSHIAAVTLNTWTPPIKLPGAYPWRICLGCHGNSARFKAPRKEPAAHEGLVAEVLKGGLACTDCHPSAHPPREQRSTR